jgi:hypothetical protein
VQVCMYDCTLFGGMTCLGVTRSAPRQACACASLIWILLAPTCASTFRS